MTWGEVLKTRRVSGPPQNPHDLLNTVSMYTWVAATVTHSHTHTNQRLKSCFQQQPVCKIKFLRRRVSFCFRQNLNFHIKVESAAMKTSQLEPKTEEQRFHSGSPVLPCLSACSFSAFFPHLFLESPAGSLQGRKKTTFVCFFFVMLPRRASGLESEGCNWRESGQILK